jgi:transposase
VAALTGAGPHLAHLEVAAARLREAVQALEAARRERPQDDALTSAAGADEWEIPDSLWGEMEPFLPHRQLSAQAAAMSLPDRVAMNGILWCLRNGSGAGKWNHRAGPFCYGGTARKRLLEWRHAGVFDRMKAAGLFDREGLREIDWHLVFTLALPDSFLGKAAEAAGPNGNGNGNGFLAGKVAASVPDEPAVVEMGPDRFPPTTPIARSPVGEP